jgi:predicted ATPase
MWDQSVGEEMISAKHRAAVRELVDETQKWNMLQFLEDRKKRLLVEFQNAILLSFELGSLSNPSYSSEIPPRIYSDGAGLSSALAYMALNRPDTFQEIQENLRSIIPSVNRVRFDRVSLFRTESETVKIDNDQLVRQVRKEYMADTLIFDFHGVPGIPASGVSEGTLIVLGLLTVIMGASRPQLIFLDDLEHGLHPMAQRELIKLIRKLLIQYPDLQIIATSHSPYLLDDLEPQEILLTWADEDGVTSCARIDQHSDFERWKNEMSPGEFWSMVGEKWVGQAQLTKSS